MYILRGRRRDTLRWLLMGGGLAVVVVVLLEHLQSITARDSFVLLDAYFISSLLVIVVLLRKSEEKIFLASPLFLWKSATRFTLFVYLVYGSTALYPFVEKRFRSEFIGEVGFFILLLVMGFPDVLLFLRAKADSGKPNYQRANLFGFWIVLLFVIAAIGAGIVAGR
ncbi:hypothetical protein [Mesorhizobium sp.]|uniref:hypothetical protein n=1 Tax=Mesorhizobium sp. TaxID=1871066 RepID=UPI000F7541E0|nr:hypothetical protein [Mesorhizobium sp.]AZO53962.1 hypothetical protein EJ077_11085 [Mesorhizobium sp. M8A.F.Ca.ET.057.01.1.1]RWE41989.1 MAG: hypothetical protein EOS80_26820 [Mesorhizobium sp.]